MKYPHVEKILADAGQYRAVVDQYRVYEGDEDLPKVFPGEDRQVAQASDLPGFIQQFKKFMADEGVAFEDVNDGSSMPAYEGNGTFVLLAEEGRVIEVEVTGLPDPEFDQFVEEIQVP